MFDKIIKWFALCILMVFVNIGSFTGICYLITEPSDITVPVGFTLLLVISITDAYFIRTVYEAFTS